MECVEVGCVFFYIVVCNNVFVCVVYFGYQGFIDFDDVCLFGVKGICVVLFGGLVVFVGYVIVV